MRMNRGKLAAILCESDMTQRAASEKAGISKYTLCAIMSGKSCKEDTAQKIADALGVKLETLVEA